MDDVNISNGDAPANEVEIDLNMFYVLMLDGVVREVDRSKVVVINEGSPRQGLCSS
jgi:hypothetical protein